jgi:hypothetical protein
MASSTYGIGIKYITLSKECLRFFSGNLAAAWGENNNNDVSWLKNIYPSKPSTVNILLLINILLFAFFYLKTEKTENYFSEKIKSLDGAIISTQNSVHEIDEKINKLLLQFDNKTIEKRNTAALYLLNPDQYNNLFFLKDRHVSGNFNKEILIGDSLRLQNKKQEFNDRKFSIGIGGLKVENTYGNLGN